MTKIVSWSPFNINRKGLIYPSLYRGVGVVYHVHLYSLLFIILLF